MTSPTPPPIPPVVAENVPEELRARVRWVTWQYEWRAGRDGKPGEWSKVPIIAGTVSHATVTNPEHFRDFATAQKAASQQALGVGFVLGDGVVGVDLDDCIDPTTRLLKPWAKRFVDALGSYTEVSPSGTGVKVFVLGVLPGDGKGVKRPDIEVYGRDRYFTVTGLHVPGTPTTVEEA